MLKRVRQTIIDHALIGRGDSVVVGFSGGADSTALVQALFELAAELDFTLYCAHYNHGIRGESAARDEAFVRDFCAARNIPLRVGNGNVPAYAAENGMSIETAARLLRYDFLKRAMNDLGAGRIAVAHHMDDNAESVLLHLVRGSGLKGLTGMSYSRGELIRPLLDVRRRDIEAFLGERGLSFCTDETNLLPNGSRNVIRLEIMPLLEAKLNPSVTEALCGCAELNRMDEELLSKIAADELDAARIGKGYDRFKLAKLPLPIRSRAVRIAFERCGVFADIERVHVEKTMELLEKHSGSALDVPHARVRISFDEIIFECTSERSENADKTGFFGEFELDRQGNGGCDTPFGRFTARPMRKNEELRFRPNAAYLDIDRLSFPLFVRTRRDGDRFRPANSVGSRKLKDHFIARRLDAAERDRIPLVISGGKIAFIPGFGIGDEFKLTSATQRTLLIEYEKHDG